MSFKLSLPPCTDIYTLLINLEQNPPLEPPTPAPLQVCRELGQNCPIRARYKLNSIIIIVTKITT